MVQITEGVEASTAFVRNIWMNYFVSVSRDELEQICRLFEAEHRTQLAVVVPLSGGK